MARLPSARSSSTPTHKAPGGQQEGAAQGAPEGDGQHRALLVGSSPGAAERPAAAVAAVSPTAMRFERSRLLTAFVLTPLLSGFYPAIFLAEPQIMPLGFAAAYLSAVCLGVPLVLLLDRRGWRRVWQFALAGILCSVPTVLAYAWLPTPEHLRPFGLLPALGVMFWGACSGMVFWLLGISGDSPVNFRTLFDPHHR